MKFSFYNEFEDGRFMLTPILLVAWKERCIFIGWLFWDLQIDF